jgi:hypothetical protein
LITKFVGPVISIVGGGIGAILLVLTATCVWPQILQISSLNGIQPAEIVESETLASEDYAPGTRAGPTRDSRGGSSTSNYNKDWPTRTAATGGPHTTTQQRSADVPT